MVLPSPGALFRASVWVCAENKLPVKDVHILESSSCVGRPQTANRCPLALAHTRAEELSQDPTLCKKGEYFVINLHGIKSVNQCDLL